MSLDILVKDFGLQLCRKNGVTSQLALLVENKLKGGREDTNLIERKRLEMYLQVFGLGN